jgi:hypothetical protein
MDTGSNFAVFGLKDRYGTTTTNVSDPDWIRIELGLSIRIRILDFDLGGQEITHKKERKKSCLLDVLFWRAQVSLLARKSFVWHENKCSALFDRIFF